MTLGHDGQTPHQPSGTRASGRRWIWWLCGGGACAFVAWILVRLLLVLMQTESGSQAQIQAVQVFFAELGPTAALAYILVVAMEVIIAPVPGLFLYAPAGMLFGPWLGGLLALLGNMLGAGLACALSRYWGERWIQRMDPADRTKGLRDQLQQRGFLVIALLRLNPLTSSDLVSYAAGLTSIPIRTVVTGTGVGIAPLCFAQSWLSDGIFRIWPGLFWPLAICTPVYLVLVVLVLLRLSRPR